MTIANYIHDLLYRYDCVIVPNFGGFVTNKTGAKLDEDASVFYPPKKQVTFNAYLQHNDGLLANHIASVEKISFQEATKKLTEEVALWNAQLHSGKLEVTKVGYLFLNASQKLIFEPNKDSNFLKESFGLASVGAKDVTRKEEVKVIPIPQESSVRNYGPVLKRTAAAAIVVGIGFMGWNGLSNYKEQKLVASQQQKLEQKIQAATFVIEDPLPVINLEVTKTQQNNFYVIAGAFESEDNAFRKVEELKNNGFTTAQIVGVNSWGLTQVAFAAYTTREIAYKALANIKETVAEEAWLLEKNDSTSDH